MEEEYYPVERNQVYASDFLECSEGEAIPLRKLIILRRFNEPSEQDIVDYLVKKAGELSKSVLISLPGGGVNLRGKSPLEKAVLTLPDNIIEDIKNSKENCIGFIRSHTKALPSQDESRDHYVALRYGVLPAQIIERNREAGNISSPKWYDIALLDDDMRRTKVGEYLMGERFKIKILIEQGLLPSWEDIDFLLRHNVDGSRTLDVNRKRYDENAAREALGFLYENFGSVEGIQRINDFSQEVIEEGALEPLLALHSMVEKMAMESALERASSQRRSGGVPGMQLP